MFQRLTEIEDRESTQKHRIDRYILSRLTDSRDWHFRIYTSENGTIHE